MPPNSHGTNGKLINSMIGNDPSFFILNLDEFRKIKAAEVKGHLNLPRNDTKNSGSGFGNKNTSPNEKYRNKEVDSSGSHHRNTLDLDGINRSFPKSTNNSPQDRAFKEVKSEGTRPVKAPILRNSAKTNRRGPTATRKTRVGLKNLAVDCCQHTKIAQNRLTLEKSGVCSNSNLAVCTDILGNDLNKDLTEAGSENSAMETWDLSCRECRMPSSEKYGLDS